MSSPRDIKTFAFFDMETTGLSTMAKITEISFVACSKDGFLKTPAGQLPRVLHKLSLCMNPMRNISGEAQGLTGLDNDLLQLERRFDENIVAAITNFLEHLQQPVCLIAHNGDRFDLPILINELAELGLHLPRSVCRADSMKIFRKIGSREKVKGTSYTLRAIFERHYGAPPGVSHRAESDTITLLKCAIAVKEDFASFVDQTAQLLRTNNDATI